MSDIKGFFVNNRFLCVRDYLPLRFIELDFLVNLIADDTAFGIYSTAGVLTVVQNIPNSCLIPSIRINRARVRRTPVLRIKIFRRRDIFLVSELFRNLIRTETFNEKLEDIPYNFRRRFVNIPLGIFFLFLVAKRHSRRNPLSVIPFALPDGSDFL